MFVMDFWTTLLSSVYYMRCVEHVCDGFLNDIIINRELYAMCGTCLWWVSEGRYYQQSIICDVWNMFVMDFWIDFTDTVNGKKMR